MIEVKKSPKGTSYVLASDLRKELEIKTRLSTWFPRMIEYGFENNKDYYQLHKTVQLVQGGTKVKFDWAVRLEMAKHIAMIQRSKRGKALREYLINLEQKIKEGEYLNRKQIMALIELCEVLGFFSVQKVVENNHYKIFDKRAENWWNYRARMFGYNVSDLKDMMKGLGKRYKNQRQALMSINKYELVRVGTFDLMKAMKKTDEYAKNISEIAKELAEKMKIDIYNDIGASIDFKTPKQKNTILKITTAANNNKPLEEFKK